MKRITLLFTLSLFINGVFGDEVSVMEGDSVTLHTNTVIQAFNGVSIIWKFGAQKTRIAQINKANNNNTVSIRDDALDGKFRGRLQLNDQTGDLTITNIRTTDFGLYEVDIHVGSEETQKSFDVKGVSNPESDQLKSVSVKDGDSVTLLADVPDIKKYDEILWRFQGVPIAEFNKSASKIPDDVRFRDKLQLDVQTGTLQIKNIGTDLSGLYEVDLTSSSYTIHQTFTVTVSGEVKSVSAMKSYPITLNTDVPDIKTYDQILLIFGCDDRIAEVNKQNEQFTLDKRFRERLTLNDQTGDLTITDIRTEDSGDYELKMSSRRRTIQRRFRVNVREQGLSSGAIAGIFVVLLLAAAAAAAGGGVIYHQRKIKEEKEKWGEIKTLKLYRGESADLKTEVTDIQRDDLIEWRFGETLIAEIDPAYNIFSTYDGDDDIFSNKLKLNHQTGDLNIKDIIKSYAGVYTLRIIRDGKTSHKRFSVSVRGERRTLFVNERESINLKTEGKDIQGVDLIEWRFGETLIANINPANNIFSTHDGDNDLFRDKLKLNHQTGDLTINDIGQKHYGVYKLKIIRDGETSYKIFNLAVYDTIEELQVYEGNLVDLKTDTDIQTVEKIEWRFGDKETLIAEINPANNIFSTYDGDDGLFKDKLKLNHQTGDLTINDIRQKHYGFYRLKIIRDGEISERRFYVSIMDTKEELIVYEGESVDLKTEVKDIQRVEKIEWRFGDEETPIAEINPALKSQSKSDKGIFRDKLKLDRHTGDLTINNIRQKHIGVYKLKIINRKVISYRRFTVSLGASRGGDSGGTEMQPFLRNSSHNSSDLPPV